MIELLFVLSGVVFADCRPAPIVSATLAQIARVGNPLDRLTRENVVQVRAQREMGADQTIEDIGVAEVRDASADGVPVRVYKLADSLPIVVFYHGGGWTIGSLNTYDGVARYLAAKLPAVVVSVGYRLAPENPFPAAVDDATTALRWASAHAGELGGDAARVAVAGDSGGANLAIVAARRAGVPVKMQALFYPSVDVGHMDTESYAKNGEGFLLTRKAVETFRSFYVPNAEDWEKPEVAPLRGDVSGSPATYVLVAGCDPLHDEGRKYASKLMAAGGKVSLQDRPEIVHGILNFYNQASNPAMSSLAEDVLGDAIKRISLYLR